MPFVMIKSKEDLRLYLAEDLKRIGRKMSFWKRFTYSETYMLYRFFKNLRHLEYYHNNKSKGINKLFYLYYYLKYRRLSLKRNIGVPVNVLGPGFRYLHPGFLRISASVSIGKHATILPNVLIGSRTLERKRYKIEIGDHCYIGTGVTILGPVKIGNNVSIGANSLVLKDVPDNCVIGGNPARILKHKK